MTDPDVKQDRLADLNLKKIGRIIDPPAEPTQQQRAAWKRPPKSNRTLRFDAARAAKGVSWMRRHRLVTAAGSAAAIVTIGVLVFLSTSPSRVEAATILASLKQTSIKGLSVTFENIGDEGARVSGRVQIRFKRDIDPEDLINGGGIAPSNLAAVYLSVDVRTDEDFDDLPGFEITAEAALSEASQWVYLRTGDISPKLLEEQPMVGVLLNMTRDGLLLDLEGTLEKDGLFGKHGLDLGLGGGPGPDQDQREITVGVSSKKRGGADRDADRGENGEDDEEGIAKKLLADFLAGRAGADQIQELVEMIEHEDVDVKVTRTGDGLYVLRATGFDDDDMLENGVLEINYRENVGVESLLVQHVGRYDGTIRLELGVPDFDEDLLSIERFENDGKTRVFKVSDFTSLLESLIGAAGEEK